MSKRIDVKILTEEQRLELEGIRRETFKRYELRIAHLKGEISHIFDFYNDEIVEK
ncbi:hypothetical protein GW750_08175 [bacterium]|nr:hypothetical protein [bacterium]